MKDSFENVQQVFIEYGSQISEILGLSEAMARMVAFLYMSPSPVSIPAICKRLELTKGTVSLYLRLLEERRIIVQSWKIKKGRQKFYEINPDLWEDLARDFKKRAEKRFELTEEALEKGREILQNSHFVEEDMETRKTLLQRIEKIGKINEFSRTIMNNMVTQKLQNLDEGEIKHIPVE
ncbi:MAG: GbsR/MarR family transcriptional regulator [Vulcanimicrobiota bacterium]